MTIAEIVSLTKDVFLGIAAVITSTVAIIGLKSWQKEIKGKAEFEVARNLIHSTYKLRDAIQSCRAIFISASEFPKDYQTNNSIQKETEAWVHVYKNRWGAVISAVQEFDTCSLEAEALWGEEIRIRTDEIGKLIRKLYFAIDSILSDKVSGGKEFKSDRKYAKETRSTAHAKRDDTNNDFSNLILLAIEAIEEQVRPHLRRSK